MCSSIVAFPALLQYCAILYDLLHKRSYPVRIVLRVEKKKKKEDDQKSSPPPLVGVERKDQKPGYP